MSKPYSRPELIRLYRAALLGCGVAWSEEQLEDAAATDTKGRTFRWPDIVAAFANVHQGTTQGGAYQVGRFLAYCVREGLVSKEKLARRAAAGGSGP